LTILLLISLSLSLEGIGIVKEYIKLAFSEFSQREVVKKKFSSFFPVFSIKFLPIKSTQIFLFK